MTALELKAEIDKELDKLSEKQLMEVLSYIKQLKFNENIHVHFERILKEDENLLRRLSD